MTDIESIINNVENIKNEVEQQNKAANSSIDPRLLIFKKGVKYRGRFVPRQSDTLLPYEENGFTSRVTGDYVPLGRAWSDPLIKNTGPDIVKKTQWDEYKKAKDRGDEAGMKEAYKLIPQRKQFANFYLIEVEGDDPRSKEQIGQVTVPRFPAGLDKEKNPRSVVYKNITEGLFGEKFKKKIGSKGFLLPNTVEDGVDFVFDVVDKGGYPNYDQSNFDLVEDSKLSLTKEQVLDILRNSHDLHEFVPALKTQDELRQILDQHWYGISASSHDDIDQSSSSSLKSLTEGLSDDDDDIPMTFSSDKSLDEELDDILK
jgi:hypothetical protein